MKSIGFVDLYISEWHANKYISLIEGAASKLGADIKVCYAYAEKDVSPMDNVTTDEWCEKNGVKKCDSIDELCRLSDFIMVLAPSNPETHLGYAEAVLKHGKRTFIDKTFAPDLATAKRIYEIAEACGTDFFSSSSLRFARELDGLENARQLITMAGGSNVEEYIVHQAEMVIKIMRAYPVSVSAVRQGKQCLFSATFEGGRGATMIYDSSLSYSVCAECEDGSSVFRAIRSAFFDDLMENILRFFINGERPFDSEQTLQVMALRDAALNAAKLVK